jgi:hypothetical protein
MIVGPPPGGDQVLLRRIALSPDSTFDHCIQIEVNIQTPHLIHSLDELRHTDPLSVTWIHDRKKPFLDF